jgi:hypothetical protein
MEVNSQKSPLQLSKCKCCKSLFENVYLMFSKMKLHLFINFLNLIIKK